MRSIGQFWLEKTPFSDIYLFFWNRVCGVSYPCPQHQESTSVEGMMARTHIFTTYFYKRLTTQPCKVAGPQ